MEAFVTGVAAGFGIAIPVGAIALLILQTGIRQGFRSSFVAGAGVASADLVYASLAVLGGAALSGAVGPFDGRLRVVSAFVLIGIAIVGLRRIRHQNQAVEAPTPDRRDLTTTYARFLALTIINPATIVYFVAVVVGLGIANGMTTTEGALFVAGAFAASLSWQTLLATVGAVAGKRLNHRLQTAAITFGNLLILAFAVMILLR